MDGSKNVLKLPTHLAFIQEIQRAFQHCLSSKGPKHTIEPNSKDLDCRKVSINISSFPWVSILLLGCLPL